MSLTVTNQNNLVSTQTSTPDAPVNAQDASLLAMKALVKSQEKTNDKLVAMADRMLAQTSKKPETKWPMTRVVKYGAGAAAIVTLASPELRGMVQRVPGALNNVWCMIRGAVPAAMRAGNAAADTFDVGTFAAGAVVTPLRYAASQFADVSVPKTEAEIKALGGDFVATTVILGKVISSIVLGAQAITPGKTMKGAGILAAASAVFVATDGKILDVAQGIFNSPFRFLSAAKDTTVDTASYAMNEYGVPMLLKGAEAFGNFKAAVTPWATAAAATASNFGTALANAFSPAASMTSKRPADFSSFVNSTANITSAVQGAASADKTKSIVAVASLPSKGSITSSLTICPQSDVNQISTIPAVNKFSTALTIYPKSDVNQTSTTSAVHRFGTALLLKGAEAFGKIKAAVTPRASAAGTMAMDVVGSLPSMENITSLVADCGNNLVDRYNKWSTSSKVATGTIGVASLPFMYVAYRFLRA